MQIFETGLCGVGVNPELLQLTTALSSLSENGIIVERFNLSSQPMEFIKNKIVNEAITVSGVDSLPLTVIDGEIVLSKRYPTNEELVVWLNVPFGFLTKDEKTSNGSGCGCSCCG